MAVATSDGLTDEERALSAAFGVAADFALRCRQLREMNVPVSRTALDLLINTLMTELWDQLFSQTDIRTAFTAALADLNRYAAGKERRG
jgi:hypothetical protein